MPIATLCLTEQVGNYSQLITG